MDKAKAAVTDFMSKHGKHDTTVDETVAPGVLHENITKTRHDETTTAVDREIHQDHHHTTALPVVDKEIMPEQHHHRMAGVEHREHRHGDDGAVRGAVESERAQFKDTRTEGATQHTSSEAPTVAGEHIHHHVHETIQPVVQKETVQPSVVHTTVPIHETHYREAQHHSGTTLPAMSMSEFKAQGGTLGGRETRHDGFEGEPRSIGGDSIAGTGTTGATGTTGTNSTTGSRIENKLEGSRGAGRGANGAGYDNSTIGATGRTNESDYDNTGAGPAYGASGATGTGAGYDSIGTRSSAAKNSGTTGTTSGAGPHKSSLLNKLDPRVDSDGDGKRGVAE